MNKVSFYNNEKEKISGVLTLLKKNKKQKNAIIACHGYRSSKNSRKFLR